jgi:hypothetical protein
MAAVSTLPALRGLPLALLEMPLARQGSIILRKALCHETHNRPFTESGARFSARPVLRIFTFEQSSEGATRGGDLAVLLSHQVESNHIINDERTFSERNRSSQLRDTENKVLHPTAWQPGIMLAAQVTPTPGPPPPGASAVSGAVRRCCLPCRKEKNHAQCISL